MLRNDFGIDCKCVKCEQNLDSNVDYGQLKEMIGNMDFKQFLMLCWMRRPFDFSRLLNWRKAHDLIKRGKFNDVIAFWQQIYPEFYPEVTEYMFNCAFNKDIFLNLVSPVFIRSVPEMVVSVESLIRVTHGFNHPAYHLYSPMKKINEFKKCFI